MADEIEIGSKAIKQIQQLKDELLAADQALIKLSQNALQAGKNIGGITTPGGLSKSGNDNAKTSAEIDALKAKYVSLNDTIVKKAEQSRLAEIRLQQQREKAFDSFDKNAKKEAAIIAKNNSEYNRTQQQLNNITKAYNDLSVKKERYNNLSANEEMRLKTLQAVTEKYNGVLKTTDAQIGRYGRNVGNYSSQWNGLGNSINQLTREAPAFAVSLNTGFLALSNNIPILADEINKLRVANVELAKSGQPTKSIFNLLAGAFFTWGTALSVGVTLLTLYGGTLIDSITGSKKKKEALEKEKEALEEKTKAEERDRDAISSKQSEEITRSQILFERAKNLTLTYKERADAIKQLRERYPGFLKGLSDEKILAGDTAEAEERLNLALINRGYALAAQEKIQENLRKELDLRLQYGKVSEKALEIRNKESLQAKDIIVYTDREDQAKQQRAENERKQILEQAKLYSIKLDNLRAERATLLDVYNENAKYISSVKDSNEEDKKSNKSKNEKIEALNLEGVAVGTTIQQLDKYIDMLETELILNAGNEEAYKNISVALDQVKKAKSDLITGGGEIISTANIKGVSTALEGVKIQLSDLQKNYLKSFVDEFASNSGFSETFKILNDEIDGFGENFAVTFNAIAESAQEAFNFISNASQQNFDSEKERLQNQYDVALGYAGENKAAQEKLATDLEKQKKDIANRENKAKQKQAIFNIAIDTAQGIISALASTPPNVPLSIFIGALGAAQIALVASQKIPQYWMGGTHDGGLMMVNDGAGSNYRETIVTPDGNIHKPQGKNVIMNAPKGTEIFTHDQWDEQMNNMLKGNGINWSVPVNNYSGMTKEDMREVMMETLGNQPQHLTNFDADGVTDYINKRGNITKSASNRGNSIKTRFS